MLLCMTTRCKLHTHKILPRGQQGAAAQNPASLPGTPSWHLPPSPPAQAAPAAEPPPLHAQLGRLLSLVAGHLRGRRGCCWLRSPHAHHRCWTSCVCMGRAAGEASTPDCLHSTCEQLCDTGVLLYHPVWRTIQSDIQFGRWQKVNANAVGNTCCSLRPTPFPPPHSPTKQVSVKDMPTLLPKHWRFGCR
jgi:hypothetical protein